MTETIQNALRRLRDDAAVRVAPESIEAKLLASYRAHHSSRRRRRIWVPAAIAASLLIAAGSLSQPERSRPEMVLTTAPQPIIAQTPPAVDHVDLRSNHHVPAKAEAPAAIAKPQPRVRRPPAQRPPQQVQEFIEIPYTPALADYDSGRVVRVNMPGASVRSLGLPVMFDRVEADLFVGDDGVARAIRLVSSSGLNSRR
ncbi:MAG TPA: hypothetical protein VEX68_29875 [Bryobacteraceae bacterium]|nr:hypothetical protein [Bryobacteraceae bacterium]